MSWLAFSVPQTLTFNWSGGAHRLHFGGRVSPTRSFECSPKKRLCKPFSPLHLIARQATSGPHPVISPSRKSDVNEFALSSPIVHRYTTDDGAHFAMWYTTHFDESEDGSEASKDMVFLATSDDGATWNRVAGPLSNGAVLTTNKDQWWAFDTTRVSVGSVLYTAPQRVRADAGIYLLYYTGSGNNSLYSQQSHALTSLTRIGVAISKDGEHFTRFEGDYPSGAILDVSENQSDLFDNATVGSPCVLYNDDTKQYVMYYHGAKSSDGVFGIGCATSEDGFSFERTIEKTPIVTQSLAPKTVTWADGGVCRPSVVRFKSKGWAMFVEVIGMDGKRRIALTLSENGASWGPLSLVLDVGEQGRWDAAAVSHPCAVVFEDGTVWLYYTGECDDNENGADVGRVSCIGVARSDGSNWQSFTRF